ncbi:MAG: OadG family protein, partial [Acutalibacteraceae bacterium]
KKETKKPSDTLKASAEKSENSRISALSAPQSGGSGIDGETLAVISAAVYAYMAPSGKKYQIKSITERQTRRRPAWASAGIMQNTRPF